MDLKELELVGNPSGHWYYTSKAAYLLAGLENVPARSQLDVGAGSGFFSRWLIDTGRARTSICVDTSYEYDWEERRRGGTMLFRRAVDAADTMDVDLLMMMDVLEHVNDDQGLLDRYVRLLPSGAHVLVTVPAFWALWSSHDVFLGHKRRYRLPEAEKLFARAGVRRLRSGYCFAFVLPIAAGVRWLGRLSRKDPRSALRRHSSTVNALLGALCVLDRPLIPINRLGGLTVLCVGQKT